MPADVALEVVRRGSVDGEVGRCHRVVRGGGDRFDRGPRAFRAHGLFEDQRRSAAPEGLDLEVKLLQTLSIEPVLVVGDDDVLVLRRVAASDHRRPGLKDGLVVDVRLRESLCPRAGALARKLEGRFPDDSAGACRVERPSDVTLDLGRSLGLGGEDKVDLGRTSAVVADERRPGTGDLRAAFEVKGEGVRHVVLEVDLDSNLVDPGQLQPFVSRLNELDVCVSRTLEGQPGLPELFLCHVFISILSLFRSITIA